MYLKYSDKIKIQTNKKFLKFLEIFQKIARKFLKLAMSKNQFIKSNN